MGFPPGTARPPGRHGISSAGRHGRRSSLIGAVRRDNLGKAGLMEDSSWDWRKRPTPLGNPFRPSIRSDCRYPVHPGKVRSSSHPPHSSPLAFGHGRRLRLPLPDPFPHPVEPLTSCRRVILVNNVIKKAILRGLLSPYHKTGEEKSFLPHGTGQALFRRARTAPFFL